MGCKDVEALESPYTETATGGVRYSIPEESPEFTIIERRHNSRRVDIGAEEDELHFELKNVAPAVANLFRRTMMRDVATVAIDVVVFHDNDGVLFDEALAHRLGLVPLAVDAAELCEPSSVDWERPNPKQVLKFELRVTAETDNFPVYSSHLKWVPLPEQDQREAFKQKPPKPVHQKILLAKLGLGQTIVADCFAIRGTGAEHTKWSPVASCTYKAFPVVEIPQPIVGRQAVAMKRLCPTDCFDIENADGGDKLVVNDKKVRDCTMCRECIRKESELIPRENPGDPIPRINLRLKQNHFIFEVESTGVYP